MDRNSSCRVFLLIVLVALRKESVDRNCDDEHTEWSDLLSLSARRAWIEILPGSVSSEILQVALRKESVDRNSCALLLLALLCVALRKESVDRNFFTCKSE